MPVRTNKVKRALRVGKNVFGAFLRLPEPGLVEVLGYAGFDPVVFDSEHGAMGPAEMEKMVLAAYAAETTPVIRVPKNEPHRVMQALDIGAMGVLAPHVRSESEAREFRDGALYPPEGHRGVGVGRSAMWGAVPLNEYFAAINGEVLMMAMIEDKEAIENIEAIASVGLDVLYVGTMDLAASLGMPGQVSHPEVMAAGDRVVAAARKHGVAAGFPARTFEGAQDALARGYRFVTLRTAESYVFEYGRQFLAAVRDKK